MQAPQHPLPRSISRSIYSLSLYGFVNYFYETSTVTVTFQGLLENATSPEQQQKIPADTVARHAQQASVQSLPAWAYCAGVHWDIWGLISPSMQYR